MHALLSDPGETSAPGQSESIRWETQLHDQFGAPIWPSVFSTTSALAISSISGLNHTAYKLAVYASSPGGTPQTTQDSLQVGGQPLPDGLNPHDARARSAGPQ